MNKPIAPSSHTSKRSLYMEITLDELCQLITHCQKTGVAEFRLDELQFKMGNARDIITGPENPARLAEDLRTAAMSQKVQDADELLITDPVAYEEAVEKAIQQEALPTDQPLPSASEAK